MQLADAFETVPDDEDLLYSIEHWNRETIEERTAHASDRMVEAFVHPRTATAARIFEASDGTYSVQPTMGDFAGGDCVVQPEEPGRMVSGSSSVTMMELDTLSEARAIAYAWMRGWVMRDSSAGDGEGAVRNADRDPNYTGIE